MKHKISIVPPDTIRRHLANTSKSKFACSFSKGKRFTNPNPEYSIYYSDANKHSMLKIKAHSPK